MTDATIAPASPDHRAAFRAATFGDVLRSEWTKLRSVRSTFWALTVTVVLGVGLGAAISAAAAHGYARSSVSGKLSWDPTGVSLDGGGHRHAGHRRARGARHQLRVLLRDDPHQPDRRPEARPGTGSQVAGPRRGDLRRGRGHQLHGVLRGPGPHQRPCRTVAPRSRAWRRPAPPGRSATPGARTSSSIHAITPPRLFPRLLMHPAKQRRGHLSGSPCSIARGGTVASGTRSPRQRDGGVRGRGEQLPTRRLGRHPPTVLPLPVGQRVSGHHHLAERDGAVAGDRHQRGRFHLDD